MFKKIPHWIKNRYAISGLVFLFWLLFFDRNDLISQFKISNELNKLTEEKRFFLEEIKKDQENLVDLKTNPKTLEKFAREHYLMKKENEDIFVIVREK
ncbi:MAG: septum formation initiator family protein [Bacteroidetes bacterium]|nr:septum formation initiator family protein [Bacteroidota bacterium]HET6243679.1 septum formation initiator family protein [Bacteroidia bacterium]